LRKQQKLPLDSAIFALDHGQENSFWKRWSKPYRLTILEEQSFKERWQISISRFGVALTLGP